MNLTKKQQVCLIEKKTKRHQQYPHAACPSRPRWGDPGGQSPPGKTPRGLFFFANTGRIPFKTNDEIQKHKNAIK